MTTTTSKPLKIFIHPELAIGHINACIGIAQALANRGHRIFFLINEDYKGKLLEYGFEEILLEKPILPPPPPPSTLENKPSDNEESVPKNPLKEFASTLLKSGVLGSTKSPIEKIRDQLADKNDMMGQMALATAIKFNPQVEAAMNRECPDVIILDSFYLFPAVLSKLYVCLSSAQPLTFFPSQGKLPPFGAGFASNSDPDTWEEYNQLWIKYRWEKFAQYQDKLNKEFGYEPPVPVKDGKTLFANSPYLNIYGYPEELDYQDLYHIPDNFVRIDAFMRKVNEPEFVLPEGFTKNSGNKLVYVSLGTLGSIDVELMKRITAVLAKTNHKYIVAKGQRADEYELPENCYGEAFLPQTRILPLVDLVITHGGNNTVTESLYFGKPMIVMPLMGDQFDGAQRVQEKGLGVRLEAYKFTESQLIETIDRLLNDRTLQDRMKLIKRRMINSNSKKVACERIEELVKQYQEQQ